MLKLKLLAINLGILTLGCVDIERTDVSSVVSPPTQSHATNPYFGFAQAEWEALLSADSHYFAKPIPNLRMIAPDTLQELSLKLQLSAAQLSKLSMIVESTKQDARVLANEIIRREKQLKRLFQAGSNVNRQKATKLVFLISNLKGKMRLMHLDASLKASRILSEQQHALLSRLQLDEDGTATMEEEPTKAQ